MTFLLIVTYLSIAVFLIAVISRFVKFATMPIHVRWELYPVAHEKGKASYGGSYLEEPDWWTKKREKSHLGELKVMIPEILLLAGVWEHNKAQWLRSFPFHMGLYLIVLLIVLLFIGGIAVAAGADMSSGFLHGLTNIVGYAGLILALIGAVALLARRVLNAAYREYTKGSDFFNLAFFVVALGIALVTRFTVDPSFDGLRDYYAHLVTFDFSGGTVPLLLTLEVVLGSVLIAYIPLTHMSHFFTKWFMYHDIRWADEPNVIGGPIEKKLMEPLSYPVSWAAAHIGGDGKKTWVDVATSDGLENE
jgi:nitrate reductase gamma subunit